MYEEDESRGWTVNNVMRYFGEHFESRDTAWDAMCYVEKFYRDKGTWGREGKTMTMRLNLIRDYLKYVLGKNVSAHPNYRRKPQ